MRFNLLSLSLIATVITTFSLALPLDGYEDSSAKDLAGELHNESVSPGLPPDIYADSGPRYDHESRFKITR